MNKQVAGRSYGEYMEENKERIATRRKQFRDMNADVLRSSERFVLRGEEMKYYSDVGKIVDLIQKSSENTIRNNTKTNEMNF